MVDALARRMEDLAEASGQVEPGADEQSTLLEQIVDRLVSELHHGETWKRLLARAVSAPSGALARALVPALRTDTLYAHHETWNEAARVACRTAAVLTPEELSRLRDAIRRSPDARRTPAAQAYAEALEQRAATILAAVQEAAPEPGTSPAAARNPEGPPPAGLPPLQQEPYMPIRGEWSREDTVPGSFDDLARRIGEQLQEPATPRKALSAKLS